MGKHGVHVSALMEIYREEFLHAIEIVKAELDPAADWDGFVEGLWSALVPAFGFDVAHREAHATGPGSDGFVTPES